MSEQGFRPVGRELRLDPTMGELVGFRAPLLREAMAEAARSVYANDKTAYSKVEAMPMPDLTAQPAPATQTETPKVASTAVNAAVEKPADDLFTASPMSSEAYFDALMNHGSENGQSQTAPEA